MERLKIAFHTNQLSLRGTEVAMYDYADYNEKLLGNKSIIVSKLKNSDAKAVEKFKKRFDIIFYEDFKNVENILLENNVDILYALKAGFEDGIVLKKIKTVVHSVFQHYQPHGNVYAYVSEWLGRQFNSPFVPHIVALPDTNENLRVELGIPNDAIVYGRHGGYETFDMEWVRKVVISVAERKDNIYFLFLNTEKFSDPKLKNIIYLEGNSDMVYKTKFINSCDAMLHARIKGESFGLAIAEFSIRNKPVLCSKFSSSDKAHFELLGEKGIYYTDPQHLKWLLENPLFLNDKTIDWNRYRDYSPEKVMNKFKEVFID